VAKGNAARAAPEESERGNDRSLKKINITVAREKESYPQEKGKVRLFFEDEASFGRISEPKYCWCSKGNRPVVPKQMVREYRDIFGAAEPETGDFFYHIEEKKVQVKGKRGRKKKGERKKKQRKQRKGHRSRQMNSFMKALADKYPDDRIVLVCDRALWHRSKYTKIPKRITVLFIPPYTPEMNPVEQVWRELRTLMGNTLYQNINDLIVALKEKIASMDREKIKSITQRDWIQKCVNLKAG